MSDKQKYWGDHTVSGLASAIWFAGWLFAIGYTKLVWWQIIIGLVIWPYYLGIALS